MLEQVLIFVIDEAKPTPAPAAPAAAAVEVAEYETVTGADIFAAYYLEIAAEPAAVKQKEMKVVETLLPEEPGETWAEEGYVGS